jgi:hypothetical protein
VKSFVNHFLLSSNILLNVYNEITKRLFFSFECICVTVESCDGHMSGLYSDCVHFIIPFVCSEFRRIDNDI